MCSIGKSINVVMIVQSHLQRVIIKMSGKMVGDQIKVS